MNPKMEEGGGEKKIGLFAWEIMKVVYAKGKWSDFKIKYLES